MAQTVKKRPAGKGRGPRPSTHSGFRRLKLAEEAAREQATAAAAAAAALEETAAAAEQKAIAAAAAAAAAEQQAAAAAEEHAALEKRAAASEARVAALEKRLAEAQAGLLASHTQALVLRQDVRSCLHGVAHSPRGPGAFSFVALGRNLFLHGMFRSTGCC